MQIGVVFPQTEIGRDPGAVRAYVQAVEEMGYNHLLVYDHVLGADTSVRPNWGGSYSEKDMFHEPFVLFGYLAAITQRIELVTGIVILPQRQTALVAKQAAEVDVLSNGRLRLGIGLGWNAVEYESLGENFHDRGKRSEEQIEVMRALWRNDIVNYEGKWHTIPGAGISPRPVRGDIPLWFGGGREEVTLKRIARLGDGWIPQGQPDDQMAGKLEHFRDLVREAGRDTKDVGIEARANMADGLEAAVMASRAWDELGVTHVGVNTMKAGYKSVDDHIEALRSFKEAVSG
ncbi:MAG: LLM class F420-dependent oxidoreductase [Dehalococcoidia bacterium]